MRVIEMNMAAILIANGVGIFLMVILLLSVHKNFRYGLPDQKLFSLMVALTIMQCVIETGTFCLDGESFTGARVILLLMNSMLYSNNIIFAFLWTLYADYKIFEDKERFKRIYWLVAIPAFIVIGGSIVNLFTPVFYNISHDNIYSRTGLYFLPYILTYIYLIYGVALIYGFKNRVNKYLFLPAIEFMIPIAIGSIIQFMCYGYSLVWLGVSVAVVSLYINVQNEQSYIDELSGLYSRKYMSNYLVAESKKVIKGKRLAGIMLDIDKFKMINDEFGHAVGDEAITEVGAILREATDSNMFVARYAGDEFVIFARVQSDKEIVRIVDNVYENTRNRNALFNRVYSLQFSTGYTVFNQGKETIDDFLRRMDSYMYIEKRKKQEQDN